MIRVVTSASRHLFEDDLLELCRNDRAGCAGRTGRFDGDDGVYLLAAENDRTCCGARPPLAVLMPIDAALLEATRALPGIDEPMLIGWPLSPLSRGRLFYDSIAA